MKKFLVLLLSFSLVLNMSTTILFAEDNTINIENTNVSETNAENTTPKDEINLSEESSESEVTKEESDKQEEINKEGFKSNSETNKEEDKEKEENTEKGKVTEEQKEDISNNKNTQLGINVSLKVQSNLKTYTDPVTKVEPSDLTISVPVNIDKVGLENTTIEIPYNFTPDKSKNEFKDFTMTEPIFELVKPTAEENSIIESYELESNKIIAHLKKTNLGIETLNFRFAFNKAYDAKIPENQLIGYDIRAIAKDESGKEIDSTDAKEVHSDTKDGMYVSIDKSNPMDDKLRENKVLCRFRWHNTYREYLLLDTTNPDSNKLYIEVPTGSVLEKELINFFGTDEITSEEDTTIPEGYSRYYRTVTDDSSTFSVWHYNGNVNNCHGQLDGSVELPDSIKLGDKVHIKLGMIYKKINSELKENIKQVNYVKTEREEWKFISSNVHSNPNGAIKTTVIQGNKEELANTDVWVGGYYNYNHRFSMKNEGKKPIKNTKMYLKQPDKGSGKINFGEIEAMSKPDNGAKEGTVNVELKIKNAKTGLIRSVLSESGSIINVNIPKLENNEYIDEVIVTPMGIDGKSKGDFASRNSILIRYRAKSWPTNFWPNGTPIDDTPVNMTWNMDYLDESNGKIPSMTTLNGRIHPIYYLSEKAIEAKTAFVSSNKKDRIPGEMVEYIIEGYNGINATGNWENPEIGVAIPKVLELQDPEEGKTFIDKINNEEHIGAVKVTLVSSDKDYNYYKFNVTGTAYENDSNVSFSIPLDFKVKEGTVAGTYKIPYTVASSSTSFEQIEPTQKDSGIDEVFGYDQNKLYSIFRDGNDDLVIADLTKLAGNSSARKNSEGKWSNITDFLVEQGGTPQMKATIYNTGNTIFENVRLYNILPKDGDNRGSTGNISFTGLSSMKIEQIAEALGVEEQPIAYYTTRDNLPGYDTDLQTWNNSKLNDLGFTTNKPKDLSKVTAIYIDFGKNKINPREKFEAILDFKVPKEANQKAVNQFLCSAKVAGTENISNEISNKITFSTEVGEVYFDENLPDIFKNNPNNKVTVKNMPKSLSTSLNLDGRGEVTLPDKNKNPMLLGHEFSHWEDEKGNKYSPGDKVFFEKGNEIIKLKAIWIAKKVKIIYNKNFGENTNVTECIYRFGETVNLSHVIRPIRLGYTFLGWSDYQNSNLQNLKDSIKIDFEGSKKVYAVWKANTYKIKFDANDGIGEMSDQIMTYDVEEALNKNTFIKKGYVFRGWNIKTNKISSALNSINSNITYTDCQNVKNLTDKQEGTVVLEAVWGKGKYTVTFDSQGGSVVPKQNNVEYNSKLTEPTAPTKEGYTFTGWYKDESCTKKWNFETDTMPDENITLYAKWENTPPIINTNENIELELYSEFKPLNGVSAFDVEDGDITEKIQVIVNTVDISKVGNYKVTYKVTDSKGASTIKTVTVIVKEISFGGGVNPNPNPEKPDNGNKPEIPEKPDNGNKPEIPEKPDNGNKPEIPEKPDNGNKPEIPEKPEDGNKPNEQEKPEHPNAPETQNESGTIDKSDAPKTGDESNIGIYILFVVLSTIGLLILNIFKKVLKSK